MKEETKKIEITILTAPRFRPWRTAMVIGLQLGVVGIGILTQSVAMQWVGFLVFLLMLAAIASAGMKRSTASTVPEARAILERIATEENGEHRRDEQ